MKSSKLTFELNYYNFAAFFFQDIGKITSASWRKSAKRQFLQKCAKIRVHRQVLEQWRRHRRNYGRYRKILALHGKSSTRDVVRVPHVEHCFWM